VRTPRWLPEVTAWTAALVLVAGVIGAWSIQGVHTSKEAQAETPVVQATREVHTRVPVTTTSPTGTRAQQAAVVAIVPELGPPPGPQYDAPPAHTAPPEQRYAFLAGITNYRSPTHDTIGAANDARFIAALLERNGWLPQNIRVVTDEEATGSAIRSGLAWLAGKSTPGTFTLFHYSGHVKQAGSTEKLWPVDRSFITDSEMGGLLSRGTGKMWVDIAGCEAGGFAGGLPSTRVLFSGSSRSNQKSYEYPQWGESIWTGLLFDIGTGQGAADADKNGRVTIGEALRYAAYYAQAITRGQRPYGPQSPQAAGDPVRGWTLADPPA
jgi:hypothetical protein